MKLAGGKYNASKFPRCKLASLQAKGPKGCPSGSKIGTGTGIGLARPVVEDPVNGKLTIFNGAKVGGRDTVLVYVFPDLGPTFVSVGKVIKTGGKYTLDFNIPPIKTLPSAPDASVTSVKTKTPVKRVKKGKRKQLPDHRPAEVLRYLEGHRDVLLRDRRDEDRADLAEVQALIAVCGQ